MRLIDAKALIENRDLHIVIGAGDNICIDIADIAKATTIDAVEVVHGRWVKDGDWLICLNCESEINVKNSIGVENRKNYCPNCGAKMDGERKNDNGNAKRNA